MNDVEGSNERRFVLVACTSQATFNTSSIVQKSNKKKDKNKYLCNYYKKFIHGAQDCKNKAINLKQKNHTKEVATIAKQTFYATIIILEKNS
jgi:hypothetical protein